MKTESIAISYKTLAGNKKSFSLDYESPEDIEEAVDVYGDDVFKKFLQMHLIKFRDANRLKKEAAEKKAFTAALESTSPEVIAAKKLLGLA
jgi:hypothetical protein